MPAVVAKYAATSPAIPPTANIIRPIHFGIIGPARPCRKSIDLPNTLIARNIKLMSTNTARTDIRLTFSARRNQFRARSVIKDSSNEQTALENLLRFRLSMRSVRIHPSRNHLSPLLMMHDRFHNLSRAPGYDGHDWNQPDSKVGYRSHVFVFLSGRARHSTDD